MRKPRDFDAELKALTDKARQLRTRKQSQLGELVMVTGADMLTVEELAGALLEIAATTDTATKEAWRKRGAAFFQGGGASSRSGARKLSSGTATDPGGAQSASGTPSAP